MVSFRLVRSHHTPLISQLGHHGEVKEPAVFSMQASSFIPAGRGAIGEC